LSLREHVSHFSRVLLIHHWDTDGICSASLIKDSLPNSTVVNRVPRIGNYKLSGEILNDASKDFDAIIVADIRLPDSDFQQLVSSTSGEVILFDHHLGETPQGVLAVSNKFRAGGNVSQPSTSWLVKKSLALPVGLRALLGVVGDKGQLEFSDSNDEKDARDYLAQKKLDERDLDTISELIDSNARLGDTSGVEGTVSVVSKYGEDSEGLLNNEEWARNAKTLDREIEAQMSVKEEMRRQIAIRRIHSKFDIVSAVARKMAWSGEHKAAVVINSGFLSEHDQLYVRKGTGPIDSRAIIKIAHERGYSAGGKDEVVGVVIPKGETTDFLQEVLATLDR